MIHVHGATFGEVVRALAAAGVACTVDERDKSGTIIHYARHIDPLPEGIRCYVKRDGCSITARDVDAAFRQILSTTR